MGKIVISEKILVNNDHERDELLTYYESKGIKWNDGNNPLDYIPDATYPYSIYIDTNGKILYDGDPSSPIPIIEYSIFKEREDNPFTIYKHNDRNILIVSHYKGCGFKLGTDNIKRDSYIWGTNRPHEYTPIHDKVYIKSEGNVIKKHTSLPLIIIGDPKSNRGIRMSNKAIHNVNDLSSLGNDWESVEGVLI